MNYIDIIVLISVILITVFVIYFCIIKPKVQNKKLNCVFCPFQNKGKYLLKDYKKSQRKLF